MSSLFINLVRNDQRISAVLCRVDVNLLEKVLKNYRVRRVRILVPLAERRDINTSQDDRGRIVCDRLERFVVDTDPNSGRNPFPTEVPLEKLVSMEFRVTGYAMRGGGFFDD